MLSWFRIRKPKPIDQQFKGMMLRVYPTAQDVRDRTHGLRVQVEHIAGNMTHQTMFQVNGAYLVSMLDAYSELNGEPMPTREMHADFLSTVMTDIKQEGPTPSVIDNAVPLPTAQGVLAEVIADV